MVLLVRRPARTGRSDEMRRGISGRLVSLLDTVLLDSRPLRETPAAVATGGLDSTTLAIVRNVQMNAAADENEYEDQIRCSSDLR